MPAIIARVKKSSNMAVSRTEGLMVVVAVLMIGVRFTTVQAMRMVMLVFIDRDCVRGMGSEKPQIVWILHDAGRRALAADMPVQADNSV